MSISGINNNNPWSSMTQGQTGTRQNMPGKDKADPVNEFLSYMDKTPAQRWQEAWLKQHGITPGDFAAMSPQERQKLMDQMQQELKQKMEDKAVQGSKTDILV
jgi:hypothetical protein